VTSKRKLPRRHYVPQAKQDEEREQQAREKAQREDIERMLLADAGAGVSTKLRDRAYWLNDVGFHEEQWLEALDALDKHMDAHRGKDKAKGRHKDEKSKAVLLALLRERPERHFHWLADLLARCTLVHKPG
jgi:hypothetical protein